MFFPSYDVAVGNLPGTAFLVLAGKTVQAVGSCPKGIRSVEFESAIIAEAYLEAAKCYISFANGAHVVYARKAVRTEPPMIHPVVAEMSC